MEKLYKVEFFKPPRFEISNGTESVEIGTPPIIIRESDIDKYKDYNRGYKNLEFIGTLI